MVLANGLGLLGVSRPGADVRRMRAHEAGWAHAAGSVRGPAWLREPGDVNALVPQLWSSTARKVDGALEVGRSRLPRPGRRARHAGVRPRRGRLPRPRPAFRDGFAGCDVYYAGKAFLCTTVARWIAEEGLSLDVCTGGELAVALRAGFPTGADRLPRQQQVGRRAAPRAVEPASAGSSSTRSTRSTGWPSSPRARRRRRRGDGPGHRRRRGAHPRVHRHRARGPEVRLLARQRRRARGGRAGSSTAPGLELLGLHSHIGSQIFDTSGFEVAARRVLALHAQICDELGVELPELDLGGGFGIAYTTQDDPSDAGAAGHRDDQDRRATSAGASTSRCRGCRSSRAGRSSGPAMFTLYEVGTVKDVELDGGRRPHLRHRRRRDERQHPHRAVRRRLLLHARQPAPPTRRPMLARVVGKHCEAGDIVVKDEFLPADVAPGDLSRCPAPAPTAGRWPATTTTCPGRRWSRSRDGDGRVIVRRETEDDLLAHRPRLT